MKRQKTKEERERERERESAGDIARSACERAGEKGSVQARRGTEIKKEKRAARRGTRCRR